MKQLYRFMDFPKFIDLVINEQLVLVDPLLWDDPYEKDFYNEKLKKIPNNPERKKNIEKYGFDLGSILEYITSNNIYALSWTSLPESDALWRIYSDANFSVRIAVDESSLKSLNNCELLDVVYKDYSPDKDLQRYSIYNLFSRKRTAFKHEHEVRLLSHIKFPPDTKGVEEYLKAFMLVYSRDIRFLDNAKSDEEITKAVKDAIGLINANGEKKTRKINISPIKNFLESVMIHPKATQWQDEMMRTFCSKYNLHYLGKSKLYSIK